jgi:hypothetical protein
MQPEPNDAQQSSPPQNPPTDLAARQRVQYTALIAAMREQNGQIVARAIKYVEAQIKAGELTAESNDYRHRLDAIDDMRRSSYVRGRWAYGPDDDSFQDYTVTMDGAGDVWIEWAAVSAAGAAAAGQPQPPGRLLYFRNPDAARGNPQN